MIIYSMVFVVPGVEVFYFTIPVGTSRKPEAFMEQRVTIFT